ncbi:hypothetical protein MTR_4g090535 [Medicago truncatula]|uniref:Uncharacterized protein n=1 Tax=Medicago truncatula TaxID=3880 RepID=A0A072UN59_MEDTR|nr:hypothetical protein MTR_4g090535 [Medicago truncatula]
MLKVNHFRQEFQNRTTSNRSSAPKESMKNFDCICAQNDDIKICSCNCAIQDETIDELSESKKTSTISKNNSKIEVIEESSVKMDKFFIHRKNDKRS